MSRQLDASLAAGLSSKLIRPAIFAALTFNSGVHYVWSGVGDFVFNGNTYKGLGNLASISAVSEGSSVKADGMTVTLNGIGTEPFILDTTAPPGLSPPVPVPAGQQLAWAVPHVNGAGWNIQGNGALSSNEGGAMAFNYSHPFEWGSDCYIAWGDFRIPGGLPDDAVIHATRPVFIGTITKDNSGQGFGSICGYNINISYGFSPGGTCGFHYDATTGMFISDNSTGTSLVGQGIGVNYWNTIDNTPGPGATPYDDAAAFQSPAIAVYFSSDSNTVSPISDALNDIGVGLPAKVYFGLISDSGALLGNPYLIFSGLIDQPTIDIGTDTSAITLALENRLTNLSRPTARRYTAADQHLKYPDDIGFNWVEWLNDVALRWGS